MLQHITVFCLPTSRDVGVTGASNLAILQGNGYVTMEKSTTDSTQKNHTSDINLHFSILYILSIPGMCSHGDIGHSCMARLFGITLISKADSAARIPTSKRLE